MAAINMDLLNKMKKQLEDKTSGNLVYASKIKGKMDIRILPPHPEMDGSPYFERICWSVGDKVVTSAETFGKPCVIEEEVAVAKALVEQYKSSKVRAEKDAAVELSKLLNSWKDCKKRSEYLIPILVVHDGEDSVTVSEPKLFSCGVSVIQKLVEVITNRKYMNGTPNGVADRVKGRNFEITKKGENKETEYNAVPWPETMEMPEAYYLDSAIPNPVEFIRKGLKSDDYLRSLIRNYLFGEEVIADETRPDDAPEQKPKTLSMGSSAPAGQKAVNLSTKKVATVKEVVEPEAEETTEEPNEESSGEQLTPDKSFENPSVATVIKKPVGSSTSSFPKTGATTGVKRNILGDLSK